jgi:DeoR/GlpR family transcriptional regulator of sugar metabolism
MSKTERQVRILELIRQKQLELAAVDRMSLDYHDRRKLQCSLAESGWIHTGQLTDAIVGSRRTFVRDLASLEKQGLIQRAASLPARQNELSILQVDPNDDSVCRRDYVRRVDFVESEPR